MDHRKYISFFKSGPALGGLAAAALLIMAFAFAGRRPEAARPYELISPCPAAPVVSTGTFRSGDIWETAMKGAPYADVLVVARALKKAGLPFPRPGDIYAVAVSTSGPLEAFALARAETVYRASRHEGGFRVEKDAVPVEAEIFESSGTLTSSLWAAMSSAGLSPAVIMEFADIFAWEIDFLTEPREGDRFALVWEERVSALGRRCGIRIKAAAYSGSEAGEGRGYWHEGSYYTEKGDSLRRAFLRAPLSYRRISSYFSKARFHPILKRYRAHNGIDYAAPPGTPVSAVADGVVSFKGWKGGYGNFIELRHGGSYITGYGHLRGFARGLRQGQKVAQGQVIGYVGSTGLSTGPHLDFSLKVNGRFTDFLRFRPPSVSSLSGGELSRFKNIPAALGPRLDALLGKKEEDTLTAKR